MQLLNVCAIPSLAEHREQLKLCQLYKILTLILPLHAWSHSIILWFSNELKHTQMLKFFVFFSSKINFQMG